MAKKTWYDFFSERANPMFTRKEFQEYREMAKNDLKIYGKYLKKGARILDIGCGIGCTAVSLSALGYKVTGVDNDRKVVEAAKQNGKNFGKGIKILYGDIFDIGKIFKEDSFDACISGGGLEHFTEKQIRNIVKLQLKLAPTVLADMPVKTKATLKHYGITEKNNANNVSPDGIYRNLWTEDYWVNHVLKGFDVFYHVVKRSHPSIGNFDILFVGIKRS